MKKIESKSLSLFVAFIFILPLFILSGTATAQCTTSITGAGFVNGNWATVVPSLYLEAGTSLTFSAAHEMLMGNDFIGLQYSGPAAAMTSTNGPGLTWNVILPASGNYTFEVLAHGNYTFSISYPGGSCDEPLPSDGRLCRWDRYAVYTDENKIDVYGIFNSTGYFVLRVTKDELEAAPGAEGVNTLIASSADGKVHLFRLGTSNTFQLHAGLDFVRFSDLPAGEIACGTIRL